MAYWRLHYHLIWATSQRLPLLTESVERQVYGTILGKAKELGVIVHAIGGVQDHIHVAVSIPPKISVSDCVRHFKGASSHYVNHQPNAEGNFAWQEGYGALTFGDRAAQDVVAYVRNQKEHHRQNTTRTSFERMAEENDGVEIASE
ncbi:MAG: IS200/IS605 family transposase [Chloroflexi bacterium]|nr:IS200/IS605 family transposase [Chloroflexota bacterium]